MLISLPMYQGGVIMDVTNAAQVGADASTFRINRAC